MSQCWGGEWGDREPGAGWEICSEDMGTMAGRNPEGSGFSGWDEAAMAQGVCLWPHLPGSLQRGRGRGKGGMLPAGQKRGEQPLSSTVWAQPPQGLMRVRQQRPSPQQ